MCTMSIMKETSVKKLMLNSEQREAGFALLITLVVVSIVLAIGLSLLFVTTKQYLLAVTASESEKAFQAAQIGLECMRYHRASASTRNVLLRDGGTWPPSLACAGVSPNAGDTAASTLYSNSNRFLYKYRYTYTFNGDQCAEATMYIADLRNADSDLNYTLTGEALGSVTCQADTVCTIIFGRGYNRACDQLDSIYTIQREITIQY